MTDRCPIWVLRRGTTLPTFQHLALPNWRRPSFEEALQSRRTNSPEVSRRPSNGSAFGGEDWSTAKGARGHRPFDSQVYLQSAPADPLELADAWSKVASSWEVSNRRPLDSLDGRPICFGLSFPRRLN
uniref:Uncharacterized protein n=1 Tax=Trichuris muris TaxID=70415 RepID=A0A5S6QSQ3_TRIMR